jgi:hypothetical protein
MSFKIKLRPEQPEISLQVWGPQAGCEGKRHSAVRAVTSQQRHKLEPAGELRRSGLTGAEDRWQPRAELFSFIDLHLLYREGQWGGFTVLQLAS